MTTIRKVADITTHEVDEVTDSGQYLTKCGDLLQGNFCVFDDGSIIGCPGCLNTEVKPLTAPSTGRAAPQYRRPKNAHREMGEGLRFSHKEIVAAMEWLERGGEKQFINHALDRANLAYRFLKEILTEHGRLEPDPDPEDYID